MRETSISASFQTTEQTSVTQKYGTRCKVKAFFKGFFFCIYSIINGNVLSQISDFFSKSSPANIKEGRNFAESGKLRVYFHQTSSVNPFSITS